MFDRLMSFIWYGVLLVVLLVLYYLGSSYRIAMVDEGFSYMEPTLHAKGIYFLDTRRLTVLALARDDLVAYEVLEGNRLKRTFGRVLAVPGMTVSIREDRLLADGTDIGSAPPNLPELATGLLMPRDTAFVGFDSLQAPKLPLAARLIPFRDIIGRVMGQ